MNTVNTNTKERLFYVINPAVAKQLVNIGYRIADLKPHKDNHAKTVFCFAPEGNIIDDFNKILNDMKNNKNK